MIKMDKIILFKNTGSDYIKLIDVMCVLLAGLSIRCSTIL